MSTATSPKQQFLDTLEKEHERTMRVLRAYPEGKDDLKAHPKSQSARDLAWVLMMGHSLMSKALTTGFDWSKPSSFPKASGTIAELVELGEQEHRKVVQTLRDLDESKLDETVKFPVGPKTIGDFRMMDFLWFVLFDHIHHRGQFSIYLRMADGRVPSIYGPSADEPWF